MLNIDVSAFERMADRMGGAPDQMAFALSKALNASAKIAREHLVTTTWPSHVKVRRARFLRQIMRIDFSNKRSLKVSYYDNTPDQRGHLQLHAKGGTKHARGRFLAIPPKDSIFTRRTAGGVFPKAMRPGQIEATVGRRGFRVVRLKNGRQGLMVGRGGRLHLAYTLIPEAKIKATVPFDQDWASVIRREMRGQFPIAMAEAMKTRRAR